MRRGLCLCGILALLAAVSLYAEDPPPGEGRPRSRTVVLEISARIIEQNQTVVWNENHQRVAISGSPVSIKIVGTNVAVLALFTPYLRREGQNLLVAQGQIWLEIPGQGIRYQSAMQTIPLDFDEPVYFFPLGAADEDSARIEIMLTMKAYAETPAEGAAGTSANAGKSGN
jgi:hypothetical protein